MIWVIEFRHGVNDSWEPLTDVHRHTVGFKTRASAIPDLYESSRLWGKRNVRLIKYERKELEARKGR